MRGKCTNVRACACACVYWWQGGKGGFAFEEVGVDESYRNNKSSGGVALRTRRREKNGCKIKFIILFEHVVERTSCFELFGSFTINKPFNDLD